MYKTFNYSCKDCSLSEDRFVHHSEELTQFCFKCNKLMTKNMSTPLVFVKGPAANPCKGSTKYS